MNGVAWGCFEELPDGLIDPGAATLTLNWLKPKPTFQGFGLRHDEVDAERNARNHRVRKWSLTIGLLLAAASVVIGFGEDVFTAHLFENQASRLSTLWAIAMGAAFAVAVYAVCSVAIMRFQRAQPRREAFQSACEEYGEVDAWRRVRCDGAFWSRLADAAFKLETAELLAGHFKTGQVMLTRAADDYGVGVLLCSPQGRVVAQCVSAQERVRATHVRDLAGAQTFFDAGCAVLMCINGPVEDRRQCEAFAAAVGLEIWDAQGIIAAAARLRAI